MAKAYQSAIFYGAPRTISPEEALIEEVHRTAGHVAWLAIQVQALEEGSKEPVGSLQPSMIIKLYNDERTNLVRVSKVAIDAGIAERTIKLAEAEGQLLAQVLQGFISDPELELTPQQQVVSRKIMRKHILAIEASSHDTEASHDIALALAEDEDQEDEEEFFN